MANTLPVTITYRLNGLLVKTKRFRLTVDLHPTVTATIWPTDAPGSGWPRPDIARAVGDMLAVGTSDKELHKYFRQVAKDWPTYWAAIRDQAETGA